MNVKSKVISLIVVLFVFSGAVSAQGVFKNQSKSTEKSTSSNDDVLRAPPGGGPDDPPPGEESGRTPVGEGLAILSLLSGGYFMLKKKNSQK